MAVGFTLTFAGFDWVMSRDPTWVSTIFGVYLFAGGYLAAVALIALIACIAPPGTTLASAVSDDQRAALGTLLFMAGILWAYMAFAQLLIIWIGDIPLDTRWYFVRSHDGWQWLAAAVGVMEFAVPLSFLLFRSVKRSRRTLGAVAAVVLVGHVVDNCWTVVPSRPVPGRRPCGAELSALGRHGGMGVAGRSETTAAPAYPSLGDPISTRRCGRSTLRAGRNGCAHRAHSRRCRKPVGSTSGRPWKGHVAVETRILVHAGVALAMAPAERAVSQVRRRDSATPLPLPPSTRRSGSPTASSSTPWYLRRRIPGRRLVETTAQALCDLGLVALHPERLPPNDGGIACGQVAVVSARIAAGMERG